MTTASGFILGFLLSTAYAAAFHLVVGGPPRKILIYLIATWLGFTIGHFVGVVFNIDLLKLGSVHLFTASVVAWLALLGARVFTAERG